MKTFAAILSLAALALPATAQEQVQERILPFRPSIHGMPFTNAGGWDVPLQIKVFGKTFGWTVSWGFCGGLCFVAQDDYYTAKWRPRGTPKPATHSGTWDLLYKRQVDSLNQAGWDDIGYWQQRPDVGEKWNPIHSMKQACPGEWDKLRASIDRGELVQLCEINVSGLDNPGNNHQVLCYGYRYWPQTGHLILYTYDPNYHDADDIYLELFIHGKDRLHAIKKQGPLKIRDVRGFFVVGYDRGRTPRHTYGGKRDSRPTWLLDVDGDGAKEVVRYDPAQLRFAIGDLRRGSLCWRDAGSTSGFGQLWDGRPFFSGDFDADGRDDLAFYYPDDHNWWLGKSTGTTFDWRHAGNTMSFGNLDDGRPMFAGDFDGDHRQDVVFYYPGDGCWWLGRSTGSGLTWSLMSNTKSFGNLADGRPLFVLDADGDNKSDVLFNYPGDHNWWLGQSTGSTLKWLLVDNTAGFGRLDLGQPFLQGDFDGDRRDELVFYSPGDQNWWIADFKTTTLAWRLFCNTSGFGTMNDGRRYHVADYNGDGRDDVSFYSPPDGQHWVGHSDALTLHWSNNQPSASYYSHQNEELLLGDLDGDGRADLVHAPHPFADYTYRRSGVSSWAMPSLACLAVFRPFGYGCPGRRATLAHSATSTSFGPALGSTAVLKLSGASPSTAASLYLGLSRDRWGAFRLPMELTGLGAKGCTQYVDPMITLRTATNSIGEAAISLPIPRDNALVGLRLYTQFVSWEPRVQAWPLSYSNAVESIIEQ